MTYPRESHSGAGSVPLMKGRTLELHYAAHVRHLPGERATRITVRMRRPPCRVCNLSVS